MLNSYFQKPSIIVPDSIEDGQLKMGGRYSLHHLDSRGNLLNVYGFKNGIVDVGKNSLLDIMFRNQTQIAAWYFGLVNNASWTAFADADTMSSHAGWAEFTTYSDSTRIAWSPDAAASKSITNSTVATFNITGSASLKGIFACSNSTKGGTTGTLWSTAAFGSVVPVNSGDQLKVTYTVNA